MLCEDPWKRNLARQVVKRRCAVKRQWQETQVHRICLYRTARLLQDVLQKSPRVVSAPGINNRLRTPARFANGPTPQTKKVKAHAWPWSAHMRTTPWWPRLVSLVVDP